MNILLGIITTILNVGAMFLFFVIDRRIKVRYTKWNSLWRAILNVVVMLGLWTLIILYQVQYTQIQGFSRVSLILSILVTIWTCMDIGKKTLDKWAKR